MDVLYVLVFKYLCIYILYVPSSTIHKTSLIAFTVDLSRYLYVSLMS